MSDPLDRSGERMVPEGADAYTFWEHVYRYRFALQFAAGRRVLDIACGMGYGAAAMLRAGAKSVTGVDIDPDICAYVTRCHGISTQAGSAEKIPLSDASVDVVVSFETIEHVREPAVFLWECRRVLVPNGVIVISTPNRDVCRRITPHNPFHCSELGAAELAALLETSFSPVRYYAQRLLSAPWWDLRGGTSVARPPMNGRRGGSGAWAG
jgi:SAM-dependent methyltransferase